MELDVLAANLAFSLGSPPRKRCGHMVLHQSSHVLAGQPRRGIRMRRDSVTRRARHRIKISMPRSSHRPHQDVVLRWPALGPDHDPHEDHEGTTSLLAVIQNSDVVVLHSWIGSWLQVRVFAADTLPVPVSVDLSSSGNRAVLLFYGSDGNVRGSLVFNAASYERDRNAARLCITSRSRFVNPAGLTSASLPGERGIIRSLFSSLQSKFGARNCRVLYKVCKHRHG
jgi:hypothetical protein